MTADDLMILAVETANAARYRERQLFQKKWGRFWKCIGCGAPCRAAEDLTCACGSVSWTLAGYSTVVVS